MCQISTGSYKNGVLQPICIVGALNISMVAKSNITYFLSETRLYKEL
jgi:hypothetical protein